ncbi:protein FAM63A [Striga asiatica]|uniref:Protein FAM63A n=1 Tax=Striga asiatica TaxID=4170 RepID=A0A5A7Q6J9_STRAF|nr:protein FAM63A [Striga asiatica]
MDCSAVPKPQSPSTSAASPPLPEVEDKSEDRVKMMVHRTKVIQFLGRKAPIVLQNDNGPCPLLAICNVLSLKNSLNLSPDISEVSQEKLLSLVAERLIDSNTDINNKDTGYVENQQQNIADAIDLLPRLTTGIDVNVKFRRIDDFEFTPECAIFDLLDIPLYHGWIVDPQDHETADAIGSKSYNTLMGELVSLETKNMETEQKKNSEDDSVDFVAATTAALGVPSPSLSRVQSFEESPHKARKGDIEEEAELLRVLKLSEGKTSSLTEGVVADLNVHENTHIMKSEPVTILETVEERVTDEIVKNESLVTGDRNTLNDYHLNLKSGEVPPIAIDQENRCTQTIREECSETIVGSDAGIENGKHQPVSFGQEPPASSNSHDKPRSNEHTPYESIIPPDPDEPRNHQNSCVNRDTSSSLNAVADSDATSGQMHHIYEHETFSSSVASSEPIYEGEECILDTGSVAYENQEPVYEGEVVLAEQVDQDSTDSSGLSNMALSVKQGEIIRNFMKNSANQLTVYGLFCLQDKVKEREICVFFRNNHFNAMFKYEGELYILATDQGFINQPDLVWEKLNEVNGDTVYMTSNFKEFKMEDHSNSTWDEQNVLASTADYLASIDNTNKNSNFNSDLQLAIALQQQEFDQQQQVQQPQHQMQQPATSGGSRLLTGPQVPRSSGKHSSSSKHESKSKEKCNIM